jgi:ADP-dependent NAD(P)H-hydrate dehydratase / NAD(P)H-hydrate epimerase
LTDAYLVAAIREAEQRAFAVVGPQLLMQRAAAGLAAAILRRLPRPYGAKVLIVIGSGNNGGDALYAGVRLLARGVAVTAWRAGSKVHAEGWPAFLAAGGREVDADQAVASLPSLAAVVDGVAGIGSRPGLAEPVARFAEACDDADVEVIAVDLPSGLAPEPPFVDAPHFTASLTVTFGGYKLCHVLEPARSACGEIELVDIGLELAAAAVRQWSPAEVAALWPLPDATMDKYTRGVVGLDTGSSDYPGAAVLGASGAIYAGSGMVRYLGPPQVASKVVDRYPNVVTATGRVQSLVLGSGWGDRKEKGLVPRAVASGVPLVVDADALRYMSGPGHEHVLLTPHAGELAYLLGIERAEVTADPLSAVRRAAEQTGAVVLLKGATQYVATPGDSVVQIAVPGPAWTAQAGSGDVLAGIAGALLAAGLTATQAGVLAASVQAMAALSSPGPQPPQDLAKLLTGVIAGLADC